MIDHTSVNEYPGKLAALIKSGKIKFAGNRKLKIYGTLRCKSGRRMKLANRVFFTTENEAIRHDYRPCGHCMREKYQRWVSK